MKLILRGHIRCIFDSDRFAILIKDLYNVCGGNLKIYMQTWNIRNNGISWRKLPYNTTPITKQKIVDYFEDPEIKNCIQHIMIEDDKKITLVGRTEGMLNERSTMPIIGWKNYWYGKYQIAKYVYDIDPNDDEPILNMRWDLFSNINAASEAEIIEFVKKNLDTQFSENRFMKHKETFGVDNVYMGTARTNYHLADAFMYRMDEILESDDKLLTHEKLVFRVNEALFEDKKA